MSRHGRNCLIFGPDIAPGKRNDQPLDLSVNQRASPDAQIDRARIDGGFGFASAAFVLGLGLLAVLERVGLPNKLLQIGVIALIFVGLVIVALFLRTMRPIDFYAGGRRLPGTYAGLAFAGVTFGLFLPFLPPSSLGIGLTSAAAGFGIGCLWALFATGPVLRRSDAYSLADLIASRFPHLLVRVPMVLLMGFCAGCIALGGYEIALRGLVAATGTDRTLGAAILAGLLVLLIVPAGLSGSFGQQLRPLLSQRLLSSCRSATIFFPASHWPSRYSAIKSPGRRRRHISRF